MKKIITLCSVILTVAILVTAFASCGNNTDTETTLENTEAAVNAEVSLTAKIGDTEALIKKGDEVIQTLTYPINFGHEFDKAYAQEHYEFIDMNFDGEADFYIAVSCVDGVISYYCWLYNSTSRSYEFSVILSKLKNISVDADDHTIYSSVVDGDETNVISYNWVDGDLVVKTNYKDEGGVPEEITKVVEQNSIGNKKPTSNTVNSGDDAAETTQNIASDDKNVNSNGAKDDVNNDSDSNDVDNKDDAAIAQNNSNNNNENPDKNNSNKDDNSDNNSNTTSENKNNNNKATTQNNKNNENKTTTSGDKNNASVNKETTKKPANTTTTAPNNDKIVLETGSLNSDGWF